MAGDSTALVGRRRARWRRPRYTVIVAVLVAVALTVVTSMVGRELMRIQSLAADVQSVVLPQIMAQQQRAIWIESLRSAANVVLYAPDRSTRRQALAKAEQLAANVTHADAVSGETLDEAWETIRLAAGKADEAQRIGHQMQAMLSEADSLISKLSASLSAIFDDSGAAIARMVRQTRSAHRPSPDANPRLEEVIAINTASHDLLASLDRGRIVLASALSLETDQELSSSQSRFVAIGHQLQAHVETLLGNADSAQLPGMIERFLRLEPLFDHQRRKLALQQEAVQASASAKLQLGVVRETLAADAAAAAEASVATIAASASRIKHAAAAMVVILIVAAATPLLRSWLAGRAATRAKAQAPSQDGEQARLVDPSALRATVGSLESLIKAQGNLEHWRVTLIAKLSRAVTSALQRVAERAPEAAPDPPAEVPEQSTADDRDTSALLPFELTPCLTHVVGLIEDIAARTSLAGLRAALDGVRLIGSGADAGAPAAPHAFAPSDALAVAAAVAEAVTEQVGTTISEINAVAQKAEPDLAQARADMVRMVAQLADQLKAIRDGDWPRASHAG